MSMSYDELLADLKKDEPGMLVAVSDDIYTDDNIGSRFRTVDDEFTNAPPLIEPFLAALRDVLQVKLRNEGGTPQSHLRNAFLRSDSSYSNALSASDFWKAMTSILG